MGVIAVKIKLMPVSPEINLEKIKEKAGKIINEENGKNYRFEEEPIAFGLKAIIGLFAWPEEKELEVLEKKLARIKNIRSVQVVDIRRAIG